MTRIALLVMSLLCVVCLIVVADEESQEVPAKPAPKEGKPAQAKVQAIQMAVQFGGFGNRFGTPDNERKNVDPQDNTERFVLLAPRGPIVVEARITLDGQPFRVAREKLVDEMLAAADSDGDGKSTWKEAVANPKFIFGGTSYRIVVPVAAPANPQQPNPQQPNPQQPAGKQPAGKQGDKQEKEKEKKNAKAQNIPPQPVQFKVLQLGNQDEKQAEELIEYFDTIKNGLVDRTEARAMLARTNAGPTFSVVGTYNRSRQPDVKSVLDQNNDGELSKSELDVASVKLKSRDANANDLLEPQELSGSGVLRNVAGQVIMVQAFSTARSRTAVGHLLGPVADYGTIFEAMKKKYGGNAGVIAAEDFSRSPELFARLDTNTNGELEHREVANLEKAQPHIRLQASLWSPGVESSSGVQIRSIAREFGNQDSVSDKLSKDVAVVLADVRLRFGTAKSPTRRIDFSQTSKRMIDRYDTNKDGHIEQKEMEKFNVALKQQFKRWDTDADGKVFAKEITESYRRQQAPLLSRVATQVSEDGPSLFAVLDQTGDQRLSLREMKTAAKQLMSIDKNGDGQIGFDEMPIEIQVSFGLGYRNSTRIVSGRARPRGGVDPQSKREKSPDWFARMDRNGDGDVTLREFLGGEEQFQKIDTNGDGFIEQKEALEVNLPGLRRGAG